MKFDFKLLQSIFAKGVSDFFSFNILTLSVEGAIRLVLHY